MKTLEEYYKEFKKPVMSFLYRKNCKEPDYIYNYSIYLAWNKIKDKEFTRDQFLSLTLTIAYYKHIDYIRNQNLYQTYELFEQEHPPHTDTYFEQTPQDFAKYFKPLTETQKKIMFLSYWCGFKSTEISQQLNMSHGSVRVHKHRSQRKLAEAFKDK